MVVGREGAPALVDLGTSVPGFVGWAVDVGWLPGGGHLQQFLGLSRGVDEREADY